jgi:hypothetical protein
LYIQTGKQGKHLRLSIIKINNSLTGGIFVNSFECGRTFLAEVWRILKFPKIYISPFDVYVITL